MHPLCWRWTLVLQGLNENWPVYILLSDSFAVQNVYFIGVMHKNVFRNWYLMANMSFYLAYGSYRPK